MSVWGRDDLDATYITEGESFVRGKPTGWYAIDREKRLVAGPYKTAQDCMRAIRRGEVGAPADARLAGR